MVLPARARRMSVFLLRLPDGDRTLGHDRRRGGARRARGGGTGQRGHGPRVHSFSFTYSWGASGLDSGAQDTSFTLIERKAGKVRDRAGRPRGRKARQARGRPPAAMPDPVGAAQGPQPNRERHSPVRCRSSFDRLAGTSGHRAAKQLALDLLRLREVVGRLLERSQRRWIARGCVRSRDSSCRKRSRSAKPGLIIMRASADEPVRGHLVPLSRGRQLCPNGVRN